MSNTTFLHNAIRARKTVIEMLEDRGYKVDNIIRDIDISTFKEIPEFDILDDDVKVYVKFMNESESLNKKLLVSITSEIFEKLREDIRIIIIIDAKIASNVTKLLKLPQYQNVELFEMKLMITNKSKHHLVPKHVILTEDEIKEVLEKYNCKKENLPVILDKDPMAKYHGMKVGDVCKIIRKSPVIGEYISYRVCT